MVEDHLKEWRGLPVRKFKSGEEPDFAGTVCRISFDWDDEAGGDAEAKLDEYLQLPRVAETPALIIGDCADDGCYALPAVTAKLVGAADKLPNLRALFLGEVNQEECEISWIENSDMSEVLNAFPGLEELRIRGGSGLSWPAATRHICLKKLVIETGGLSKAALAGIHQSVLPELEFLEIWTGDDNYGWDGTVDDVRPFLHENPFRKLKHLGLRNSMITDEIAKAAADAPVLEQLELLDLSLGTLRDAGAEALLAGEKIKQVKKLDLHHHYMSTEMMERFLGLGIQVDVSERQQPDEYDGEIIYYISVSE